MWGIVNSLGLKEGLQEFREQFDKDAKSTIANTQFAKDRGIDVERLHELQEDLVAQAEELHERTIGATMGALAQDETFKQLLELKAADMPTDDVSGCTLADAGQATLGAVALTAAADAVPASSSFATPGPPAADTATNAPARATAAALAPAGAPRTEQRVLAASPERPRAEQRARHLEAEVRELTAARATGDAQLTAVCDRAAELENHWAELSAVSDEALSQAESLRQEVALLRRALEEKDAHIAQFEDTREQLTNERCRAVTQLEELEKSFQERLQREVSQKEQELLEEVTYLRRSNETKDRRLKELTQDKAVVDKRLLAHDAGSSGAAREAMLEAHTAIAKAFGDVAIEHPCCRLFDEPMLKFTAALFRQSLFRRMFFVASALMWVFALRHAIAPGSEAALHI